MLKANVVLRSNNLPRYRDSGKRVHSVLMEAGFDVERGAKQNITDHDLIDTGALKNSVTVSTPDESTVRIGPSVHYGIWHEIGTKHHIARPYLVPAFDVVRAELPARMRKAFG